MSHVHFLMLKRHQELILKECTKEEVDLLFSQEEHDIIPFMRSLLGFSILFFSFLILIYAPGKTIARYGNIIDLPGTAVSQKEKTSNLLVLLNDGKVVKVRKPEWFYFSKNKTVILQETTSMFLGFKRYGFYNNVKFFNRFNHL